VLGVFLSVGLVALFQGQGQTGERLQAINMAQENARIALELLASDIAQVGFLGDFDHRMLTDDTAVTFQAEFPVVTPENDCIGGPTGTNNGSFPTLNGSKFRMLYAEHNDTGGFATLSDNICTSDSPLSNSDAIQIKRFIAAPGISRADIDDPPDVTAAIDIGEQTNRFYGYANMTSLVFYSGKNTGPSWDAAQNGRVFQYQHRVYWVSNSTIEEEGRSIPSLYRQHLIINSSGAGKMSAPTGGPLVSGIESIAFAFGLDLDGDRSPDRYVPTDNMTNQDWEGITGDIVTVRIQVLGRSDLADAGYTDEKTYEMISGTLGPFNDNFHRNLVSTTVSVRNLR
jgi:type IV pilus assembly protein PilW